MDKCLIPTALKSNKYLSNVHKIGGTHVQLMNNHYAKLNIKGWKLFELHFTQTRHHLSILRKKCPVSTPVKNEKVVIKCAQNGKLTSSIFEQSLCKV